MPRSWIAPQQLARLHWLVFCLLLGFAATLMGTSVQAQTANTPPAGYTLCAAERGQCSFSGTAEVVYGSGTRWTTPRSFTASVACNNATFGDPTPFVVKSCYQRAADANLPPAGYTLCAAEGGQCAFTGTANVVYGARSSWTAPRSFSNGLSCRNATFGMDPLRFVVKACYVGPVTPPPTDFALGGTVTGLAGGNTVVVRNNGGSELSLRANGSFLFPTRLVSGSSYAVTVQTQPAGQTCTVANGSGTVANVNIGNVAVTCASSTRLDPAFGVAGRAVHADAAGGGGNDSGNAMVFDASGRTVVAGHSTNANGALVMTIWRHTATGALDTTFNGTGFATHNGGGGNNANDQATGTAVAVDSGGRIVVAGYSIAGNIWGMALWRFNADGTPDNSFGSGGMVRFDSPQSAGVGLALDASGRMLVAGFSYNGTDWDATLWRYTAAGALDTGFNGTGLASANHSTGGNNEDIAIDVAVDANGRPLMTGYSTNTAGNQDMTLWRYNANGTPDTSFNATGILRHDNAASGGGNDVGRSIAFDTSGRIVVAGWSPRSTVDTNGDLAIWRVNANGTLDTSFNGVGHATHNGAAGGNDNEEGRAVVIDSAGRILVAGQSFNAAGNPDMVVWRYNADGTLDNSFASGGFFVHAAAAGGTDGSDGGRALRIDSSGRIVVAGRSANAAGNLDLTIWRILP